MNLETIRGKGEFLPVPIRIKEAREYNHLRVTELADLIGKTRQAVFQYENGTTRPAPEVLSKIAMVTGFPVTYFFKLPRPQQTTMSQIPLYRGSQAKTENLKRSYEINSFMQIKKRWGVSLAAMIMRAYALGIIDEQKKSYLFRQISSQGYRRHEPYDDEIVFMEPSMIYNSIKLLIENRIVTFSDFVDDIAIPIDALVAICVLPEGFLSAYLEPVRYPPRLRLVK